MLRPPTLLLSVVNIEQLELFDLHTHEVICIYATYLEKLFLRRLNLRSQ